MNQENKNIQNIATEVEKVKNDAAQTETYSVVVHPIPALLKKQFALALDDFVSLQAEIEEKMAIATERNSLIQTRIYRLVHEAKVEINQDHYSHFNQSIAMYMELLKEIHGECSQEIEWSKLIIALDAPEAIQVPLDFDVEFYRWAIGHDALTNEESYAAVNAKIEQMRRHSKVVRKDVRVSFSRYLFGFSAQLKQVEIIEHSLLRTYFEHQEHQARLKKEGIAGKESIAPTELSQEQE